MKRRTEGGRGERREEEENGGREEEEKEGREEEQNRDMRRGDERRASGSNHEKVLSSAWCVILVARPLLARSPVVPRLFSDGAAISLKEKKRGFLISPGSRGVFMFVSRPHRTFL